MAEQKLTTRTFWIYLNKVIKPVSASVNDLFFEQMIPITTTTKMTKAAAPPADPPIKAKFTVESSIGAKEQGYY